MKATTYMQCYSMALLSLVSMTHDALQLQGQTHAHTLIFPIPTSQPKAISSVHRI